MRDTTGFIIAPKFNGLTKISFDERIKREAKSLPNKVKQMLCLKQQTNKEKNQKSFKCLI